MNLIRFSVVTAFFFDICSGVRTKFQKRNLNLSGETTIQSPGYPWKNYSSDTIYTWTVTAPTLAEEISIEIELDVHSTRGYPCGDYLKIEEIQENNLFTLFNQCGNLKEKRVAIGNKLNITLYSNYDVLTGKGFRLRLKVSKKSTTSTITTSSTTRLLSSKMATTTTPMTTTPKTTTLKSTTPRTTTPRTTTPKTTTPKTTTPKTTTPKTTTRKTTTPKTTTPKTTTPRTTPPKTTTPRTTTPKTTTRKTTTPKTTTPRTTTPKTTTPKTTTRKTTTLKTTTLKTTTPKTITPKTTTPRTITPKTTTLKSTKPKTTTPKTATRMTTSSQISISQTKQTRIKALSTKTPSAIVITQISTNFTKSKSTRSTSSEVTKSQTLSSAHIFLSLLPSLPSTAGKDKTFKTTPPLTTADWQQTIFSGKQEIPSTNYYDRTTIETTSTSEGFIFSQEIVILIVAVGIVEVTLITVGILAVRRQRQKRINPKTRKPIEANDQPVSLTSVYSIANVHVYDTISITEENDGNPYKDLPKGVYDTTLKRRSHVICNESNYSRESYISCLFRDSRINERKILQENLPMFSTFKGSKKQTKVYSSEET